MEIDGYRAVIEFDPDIDMFRGDFLDLNGGADFYAKDVAGLRREGAISLKVFLDMCREVDFEPRKRFSGKFNLRIPPTLHATIAVAAAAEGKSLSQWVTDEFLAGVSDSAYTFGTGSDRAWRTVIASGKAMDERICARITGSCPHRTFVERQSGRIARAQGVSVR